MRCGVGCRCGLDPMLLWLWRRPATTALIGPLAWEPPCAMGVAQENGKKTHTHTHTHKLFLETIIWEFRAGKRKNPELHVVGSGSEPGSPCPPLAAPGEQAALSHGDLGQCGWNRSQGWALGLGREGLCLLIIC